MAGVRAPPSPCVPCPRPRRWPGRDDAGRCNRGRRPPGGPAGRWTRGPGLVRGGRSGRRAPSTTASRARGQSPRGAPGSRARGQRSPGGRARGQRSPREQGRPWEAGRAARAGPSGWPGVSVSGYLTVMQPPASSARQPKQAPGTPGVKSRGQWREAGRGGVRASLWEGPGLGRDAPKASLASPGQSGASGVPLPPAGRPVPPGPGGGALAALCGPRR